MKKTVKWTYGFRGVRIIRQEKRIKKGTVVRYRCVHPCGSPRQQTVASLRDPTAARVYNRPIQVIWTGPRTPSARIDAKKQLWNPAANSRLYYHFTITLDRVIIRKDMFYKVGAAILLINLLTLKKQNGCCLLYSWAHAVRSQVK